MNIQGAAEPIVDQHVFLVGRPPISEFVLYDQRVWVSDSTVRLGGEATQILLRKPTYEPTIGESKLFWAVA